MNVARAVGCSALCFATAGVGCASSNAGGSGPDRSGTAGASDVAGRGGASFEAAGASGTEDPGRPGGAGHAGSIAGAAGMSPVGSGLVHPGGLWSEPDLERVRAQVAARQEPWLGAWTALEKSDAMASYTPKVSATISDAYAIQNQGHAAYVLSMKWVASGDASYAEAAIRILDAWIDTVKDIQGTTLRTGIGATQLASAAEILAHGFHGGAGWPAARVALARDWFKDVVWPDLGEANAQRSSNWGTAAMAGCMATAIFADDAAKYDYTVAAFRDGFSDAPDGCSGVAQYICDASGQATEAGRDQGHAQGGVAHLVEVAMMAWNQGLNLLPTADHRLVAGMEYLAKYNLGGTVPYDPNFPDPCNVHPNWATISSDLRGSFSPVYELANKLFTLAGELHPYTAEVLLSPGYAPEKTNSDHVGLGTLTAR